MIERTVTPSSTGSTSVRTGEHHVVSTNTEKGLREKPRPTRMALTGQRRRRKPQDPARHIDHGQLPLGSTFSDTQTSEKNNANDSHEVVTFLHNFIILCLFIHPICLKMVGSSSAGSGRAPPELHRSTTPSADAAEEVGGSIPARCAQRHGHHRPPPQPSPH